VAFRDELTESRCPRWSDWTATAWWRAATAATTTRRTLLSSERHVCHGIRLAAVEQDDARVHVDGGVGGGIRHALSTHDEHPRGTELEEHEQEWVPDDALQYDNLHHEVSRSI
jgi:hypothetical protein